jgi:hypothetical protein
MQFAGFPILLQSEAPPHIANGTMVTFIPKALRCDPSVGSRIPENLPLGASNHSLRNGNARHFSTFKP